MTEASPCPKNKYLFSHLEFLAFTMSQVIPLPFTLFPRPGILYEVFWNSEHVHLYEVHFSLPLKERNLHVQQRRVLIRSVEKQLADKTFSAHALSTLKLTIQVAITEASMLWPVRFALLVDHKQGEGRQGSC